MARLEVPRLRLRPLAPENLEHFVRWHTSRMDWQRLEAPWRHQRLPDEASVRSAFLVRPDVVVRPAKRLCIELHGTPIGWVERQWLEQESRLLEVGIVIAEARFRGQGYGREALRLWLGQLFASLPLGRIGLRTWSGNRAAQAMACAAGMTLEGRMRAAYVHEGQLFDAMLYGVLRSEWRED